MQKELCALPGLSELWLPLLWRLPDLQHLGGVCCSLPQVVSAHTLGLTAEAITGGSSPSRFCLQPFPGASRRAQHC